MESPIDDSIAGKVDVEIPKAFTGGVDVKVELERIVTKLVDDFSGDQFLKAYTISVVCNVSYRKGMNAQERKELVDTVLRIFNGEVVVVPCPDGFEPVPGMRNHCYGKGVGCGGRSYVMACGTGGGHHAGSSMAFTLPPPWKRVNFTFTNIDAGFSHPAETNQILCYTHGATSCGNSNVGNIGWNATIRAEIVE